ncbi:MAG: ROK family protein [Gemmatimonadetes bacterium]|nr:ROK family protein [Gemmatimonadota bacterium]MYB59907.1 ROK family protein [Gemmatimonadota bacterium]
MSQPDRNAPYYLGHDIGGTKLAVTVADRNGKILRKIRRPTVADRGPRAVVASLVDMSREAMARAALSPAELAGVGVSCGGPLDTETGVVYAPPNLPGWDEVPLKAWLESALSLPVFVENDANASALAEWSFGAGRGCRHMVYMTMSTGIGGGIILDGRLYRGPGDTAGEVGHMTIVENGPACGCGKRGCLEALCSGPSIARRAREIAQEVPGSLMVDLAGGEPASITAETVMDAARQDDPAAREIVDETARYMAVGLGNIVNILNPEVIVIGTILVKAQDLLLEPIRAYLRRETWPRVYDTVRVVPAGLGDEVGDLAAIAVIRQAVQSEGSV